MENQKKLDAKECAELIQSFLARIKSGESEQSVKNDFIDQFRDVDHPSIMKAEQILIDNGINHDELGIFFEWHGELARMNAPITHTLAQGHPVQILNEENLAIDRYLKRIESDWQIGNFEVMPKRFIKLSEINRHYMKKEGLIIPMLYHNGFTGSSQIMWALDEEIKRDVKKLTRDINRFFSPEEIHTSDQIGELKKRVDETFDKIRLLISREESIFFPITLQFLSQEDWLIIYRDMFEYGFSFIEEHRLVSWAAGEVWQQAQDRLFEKTFEPPEDYIAHGMLDGKIKLPTGEISIRQLEAILKLLPLDITFIDAEDKVQFFMNEGKVFPRPKSILGRNVYDCHPPRLAPMLQNLLDDFKSKTRTSFEICKFIDGKPICVKYLGVYDDKGKYIGAVQFIQNFDTILDSFKHLPKF